MTWTAPFSSIGKNDADSAGGKGASLGEMTQASIPVPPGFVVLAPAFEHFLEEADLNIEIDSILKTVDVEMMHTIEGASGKIQELILSKEIPQDIEKDIQEGFKTLNTEFVAVRSSATAEDSASAAWAGQLDTFLNTTESSLLENVRRCWASLFTPRAIFYRFEKGLHTEKVSVAVVVQKMVNSESAGIAFSVHPVTEDRNQIIIEAAFGLGEAVVSGQITPDSYVVTKKPLAILDKNLIEQDRALYRKQGGGNEWVNLSSEKGKEQEISDEQILELAELIIKIENHYGFPVDIEWATEGGKFYITQSRPITTLSNDSPQSFLQEEMNIISSEDKKWILGEKIPNSDIFFFQIPFRQFSNESSYSFIEGHRNVLAVFNGFEMDFYVDENDSGRFARSILEALAGRPGFGEELNEKIREWSYAMIEFAKKVEDMNLTTLSNQEICNVYDEHSTIHAKLYTYGWLPVAVDIYHNDFTNYLKEYLNAACASEEVEEAFVTLTTPLEKTIIAEEREEFLAIAKTYLQELKDKTISDGLRTAVESHAEKWGHLGYIYAGNVERFNSNYYLKELSDFATTNAVPEDILNNERKQFVEAKNNQEALYKKLKTPDVYRRLFAIAQGFALTKLIRRHAQLFTLYTLHTTLLQEIAKRLKLTRVQVQFMLQREVKVALLEGALDVDVLTERLRHCVLYTGKNFEEVYIGDQAKKFTDCIVETVHENVTEFKGQIANRGKAKGIVRLIFRASDVSKMQEGDILVSIATDPDVVPAMKKAGAIVTDQGGITAHAAIVSRELGKPCIIGTKIATKVLKDGDLVEVDAEKGIVRILQVFDSSQSRPITTLSEVIKSKPIIDPKNWNLYFTRFRCPLVEVAIQLGWSDFMFPVENIIVNSAEVYLKEKQYQACVRLFREMLIKDPEYLLRVPKQAYAEFEMKKQEFLVLESTDYAKLSTKELEGIFKTWFEWLHVWMVTNLAPANLAEGIVTMRLQAELARFVDPVKDFEKFQQLHLLFVSPSRPGFLEEYESELHSLAEHKDVLDEAKIASMEKEYGWLGDTGRLDNFWDADEIRSQVLLQKKKIKSKEEDESVEKELAALNADSDLRESVELARTYVHFRTFRIDVCLIFCYRARFLFKEISERLNISFIDFTYMTFAEIISALQDGRLPEDFKERKLGFAVILQGKDAKILSGFEAKELAEQLHYSGETSVDELRGTTACIGKVQGLVKLVFTKADSDKVEDGDILVSSMTKPELVPAMKRAGAIITDEGGITCHAAIVSRELKKPCIIGTKIATKVLKDGDLVEVDAEKGIVRILQVFDSSQSRS
ncbi:MAG: PEP/pyruvate-binding domain-containing protein [Patescibacteria group bacterium]